MDKLYNLIIKHSKQGDTDTMQRVTKILTEALEDNKDSSKVYNEVYYMLNGGHFDKTSSEEIMSKLYYEDTDGKHYGPYWTTSELEPLYNTYRNQIPKYTLWDFIVTINMIKSDYCLLLKRWFPNITKEEILDKCVELSLNYLIDEDNPFGTEKIWKYFNS